VQKEDEYVDSGSDVMVYSNPPSALNSFADVSAEEFLDHWPSNMKHAENPSQQKGGSTPPASVTSSNMSSESGPLFKNQLPSIVDDPERSGIMRLHMADLHEGEDLHEGR
jgi:hypothetical protein